jgi:hypothetical protein
VPRYWIRSAPWKKRGTKGSARGGFKQTVRTKGCRYRTSAIYYKGGAEWFDANTPPELGAGAPEGAGAGAVDPKVDELERHKGLETD